MDAIAPHPLERARRPLAAGKPIARCEHQIGARHELGQIGFLGANDRALVPVRVRMQRAPFDSLFTSAQRRFVTHCMTTRRFDQ